MTHTKRLRAVPGRQSTFQETSVTSGSSRSWEVGCSTRGHPHEVPQGGPVPELGWWERAHKQLVMVHGTDDRTIRGYVKEVAPDGVLLASAEYLPDEGPPMPLGGEVFIPQSESTGSRCWNPTSSSSLKALYPRATTSPSTCVAPQPASIPPRTCIWEQVVVMSSKSSTRKPRTSVSSERTTACWTSLAASHLSRHFPPADLFVSWILTKAVGSNGHD